MLPKTLKDYYNQQFYWSIFIAIVPASDLTSIFYISQPDSCGLSINSTKDLSTQPYQLRLNEPAKYIDVNCTNCYITDIMLGEEIEIATSIDHRL